MRSSGSVRRPARHALTGDIGLAPARTTPNAGGVNGGRCVRGLASRRSRPFPDIRDPAGRCCATSPKRPFGPRRSIYNGPRSAQRDEAVATSDHTSQFHWALLRCDEAPRSWNGIIEVLIRTQMLSRVQLLSVKQWKVGLRDLGVPPRIPSLIPRPITSQKFLANDITVKIEKYQSVRRVNMAPGMTGHGGNPLTVETM